MLGVHESENSERLPRSSAGHVCNPTPAAWKDSRDKRVGKGEVIELSISCTDQTQIETDTQTDRESWRNITQLPAANYCGSRRK